MSIQSATTGGGASQALKRAQVDASNTGQFNAIGENGGTDLANSANTTGATGTDGILADIDLGDDAGTEREQS